MQNNFSKNTKGFTLIELLVVIAIVAVLSVVVILALNPAELLKQARDSNRVSDMASLKSSLQFYITDVTGNAAYTLGDGTRCFVDQIGAATAGTPVTLSAPWTTGCSTGGASAIARFIAGFASSNTTAAALRSGDGTGWIPVNFNKISSGSPLSSLPIDPAPNVTTNIADNFFYAYRPGKVNAAGGGTTCLAAGTDCTNFELVAHMESIKFRNTGTGNVESKDGGGNANSNLLYEVGTYPGLTGL